MNLHKLLLRQLRRHGGSAEAPPADWQAFIAAVNEAYGASDQDRSLLERSMDLVSQELMQANRELSQERARLVEAFTHSPVAVALFDDGRQAVTFANPAWARLQAGNASADLSLEALVRRVKESGEVQVARELAVRLSGPEGERQAFFNLVAQPLEHASGDGEDVLVHAIDVSEQVLSRKSIEEKASHLLALTRQLAATNHELDQFAYAASHDLKTPLRGIASLTEWLEEDLAGALTPETRRQLGLVRSRVVRLSRLVDGLLAYARAGKTAESLEPLELSELVAEIVELLQPPATVAIEVGPLPRVRGARALWTQVFQNLIANALSHGVAQTGRIRVEAAERDEDFEFSVSDDGPGIPEAFHDRIFGLFQRLEPPDARAGAGVGLALVKKIVEAHGGRVWVESGPGRGSTFRFRWPRHQASLEDHAPSRSRAG